MVGTDTIGLRFKHIFVIHRGKAFILWLWHSELFWHSQGVKYQNRDFSQNQLKSPCINGLNASLIHKLIPMVEFSDFRLHPNAGINMIQTSIKANIWLYSTIGYDPTSNDWRHSIYIYTLGDFRKFWNKLCE